MKMTEKIRQLWHDLFYFLAPQAGVDFALRCKEAAEHIDLKKPSVSVTDRFRFYLHISLCQGCKNYLSTTRALKRTIRQAIFKTPTPLHLEQLNQELMTKHAKPSVND